jgi:hypothetical protein
MESLAQGLAFWRARLDTHRKSDRGTYGGLPQDVGQEMVRLQADIDRSLKVLQQGGLYWGPGGTDGYHTKAFWHDPCVPREEVEREVD